MSAPYLAGRLQLSCFYFGGGVAPFVYRSPTMSGTGGFMGFEHANNTLAYFGEVGILWAVTPMFTLGAAVNETFVNVSGMPPAAQALDITLALRFYLSVDNRSTGGSSEFKGWRYPFGNPIH